MAKQERRHASFELDALMVVEVDKAVNQIVRVVESGRFMLVDIKAVSP